MADRSETLQVTGIHCMQCIQSIGAALGPVDGLTAASATLTGAVSIRYDEAEAEVRERVVGALAAAGFPLPGRRAPGLRRPAAPRPADARGACAARTLGARTAREGSPGAGSGAWHRIRIPGTLRCG